MALCLNGLKIHLGPELRAMFPVVLNMGISGDIELNGAADPDSLRVAGTIHLDGGEVRSPIDPLHPLLADCNTHGQRTPCDAHLTLICKASRDTTCLWETSIGTGASPRPVREGKCDDRASVVQVNLVATQLVLDREHPNRLVFSPSRGLDPLLDLRLRGAQVYLTLCPSRSQVIDVSA